jgi:hypothetical protein
MHRRGALVAMPHKLWCPGGAKWQYLPSGGAAVLRPYRLRQGAPVDWDVCAGPPPPFFHKC